MQFKYLINLIPILYLESDTGDLNVLCNFKMYCVNGSSTDGSFTTAVFEFVLESLGKNPIAADIIILGII